MKRTILILAAIVLACLACLWIYDRMVPEETKIRRMVQRMADGFNETHAGGCLSGLADNYKEEKSRATKDDIHKFLVYLFLKAHLPKTKEFRYQLEIPEDKMEVQVDGNSDPPAATVVLQADFFDRRPKDGPELRWSVRITGQLQKGDEGWRIHSSSHETLEGRMSF